MTLARITALASTAVLCAAACADDTSRPCEAPAGTYTLDVAYVEGDCSGDLISALLGAYPQDHDLGPEPCGTLRSTDVTRGESCDLAIEIVGTANEAGYEDSTISVGIDCDDGSGCSAFFNAYWTRR